MVKNQSNYPIRRTPFGETIEITVQDLKPKATFYFEALPSGDLLNAPLEFGFDYAIPHPGRTLVLT